MIKTIIFDLGRVIVPFDFKRGYDRIAPHCGCAPDAIADTLRASDLVVRLESGQMAAEEFYREVGKLLDMRVGYQEFCDIWSYVFLPETLIPDQMVEALHRRYRVLLLSNTNSIHFDMIERNYPILRHFDQFVLSHRVGAMKPSPTIYRAAIEAAQCAPDECFFTDDVKEFVEGARAAGIDAVQFENSEQVARELRARGVDW